MMDELNKWHSHPDYTEEELAYMYRQQQEEEHARMQPQHHFSERLSEQQQYLHRPPPPPPMAPPRSPIPFQLPHHHHSFSNFVPGFGVPALPPGRLPFGAVNIEPGQPSSSSSNCILSFGGHPPSTLNFSAGGELPEAAAGGGGEAVQQMPAERRSRTHLNTQEHVVAERKRREKMQQQFMALATIVPDLTKTDKVSLLGSTIKYVKQLEDKVKTLEGRRERRMSEPTVFETKCHISIDSDASCSNGGAFVAGGFSPTIEASIHGDTVLLKICCKERRGVLVMIISELENQGLSIINTSVLPFTDSCLNITITAKIGEGFSSTVELITKMTATLRGT